MKNHIALIFIIIFVLSIVSVSAESLYYNFGDFADDNDHSYVYPTNAIAQKFTSTTEANITNISVKQWVNDYGCEPYNFHVAFFSNDAVNNKPNISLAVSGLRQGSACTNSARLVPIQYHILANTTYWLVLYADNVTGTKNLGNYQTGTSNSSYAKYNNTKQCATFNLTTGNCTSGWAYYNTFYATRTVAFDMKLYNSSDMTCHEVWNSSFDFACDGFISSHTKYYTDSAQCNTTTTLPVDNGSISSCCVENWVSNNTVCNLVNYTVQYYDSNSCNTTFSLPYDNGTLIDCACNKVCESKELVNSNCCIVTPSVQANTTFQIFDDKMTLVDSGRTAVLSNLSNENYFAFSQSYGLYHIVLSDGYRTDIEVLNPTEQLTVNGRNDSWILDIIFIVIISIILYIPFYMNKKNFLSLWAIGGGILLVYSQYLLNRLNILFAYYTYYILIVKILLIGVSVAIIIFGIFAFIKYNLLNTDDKEDKK